MNQFRYQGRDMAAFIRDGFELTRDIAIDGIWEFYVPEDCEIELQLSEANENAFIDNDFISPGESYYITSGLHKLTVDNILPRESIISGVYPNPFNSNVTIELSDFSDAEMIEIFDVMGRRVTDLQVVNKTANWKGDNSDGIIMESGISQFVLSSE